MKLTKALKVKNSVINEIQVLKDIIAANNVNLTKNINPYDINERMDELNTKIEELATLKGNISKANIGIYNKIFRIAEYKGMITYLKTIPTTNGISVKETFNQTVEVEYSASIKDIDVKDLTKIFTKKIEVLQDEIDDYNATKEI